MKLFKIFILVAAILALANSAMAKATEGGNYGMLSGTYLAIGYGKSIPQSKIKHSNFGLSNDTYLSTKLKNSDIFKVAIGKEYAGNFRTELEFLSSSKYKFSKTLDGVTGSFHITNQTYLVNTYYKLLNNTYIQPYVGVGIGFSRNSSSNMVLVDPTTPPTTVSNFAKAHKTNFAYNLMVGAQFEVTKNVFFDLSYKYADLGKVAGSTRLTNVSTGSVSTQPTNLSGRLRNNIFLLGVGFKL